MIKLSKKALFSALAAGALLISAPVFAADPQPATSEAQPAQKHHSLAKGAVVGGAGGAVLGHSKKSAAVGAAGGALWQNHKNKKEAKAAAKAQQ